MLAVVETTIEQRYNVVIIQHRNLHSFRVSTVFTAAGPSPTTVVAITEQV